MLNNPKVIPEPSRSEYRALIDPYRRPDTTNTQPESHMPSIPKETHITMVKPIAQVIGYQFHLLAGFFLMFSLISFAYVINYPSCSASSPNPRPYCISGYAVLVSLRSSTGGIRILAKAGCFSTASPSCVRPSLRVRRNSVRSLSIAIQRSLTRST
jgi:hypothetical protein